MNFDERYLTCFNLKGHPMSALNIQQHWKENYFIILEYLLLKTDDTPYVKEQLKKYQQILGLTKSVPQIGIPSNTQLVTATKQTIHGGFLTWAELLLALDLIGNLMKKEKINAAINALQKYVPKAELDNLRKMVIAVLSEESIPASSSWIGNSVHEINKNIKFLRKEPFKILVTANMSAGKSTLINCLIGKSILPTSQERCTSNLLHIYETAQEDDTVTLISTKAHIHTNGCIQGKIDWSIPSDILCSIHRSENSSYRLCFIDTPGVNSATAPLHETITREAILNESYDRLIYIFKNPGTDEEIKHLNWIAQNVDKEKIIFVLNKLDNYKVCEDDISETIQRIKEDLKKLGFIDPIVCPISAYFGLLLKKELFNQKMNQDELDDFSLFFQKFSKEQYDLSKYYPKSVQYISNINRLKALGSKCGIDELEKIIFGGRK